jgi:ADP-heptose:LPS heptosyltransferase
VGPWPLEDPPHYEPEHEDLVRVQALIDSELGTGVRRLVILNPNSGDLVPLRRWPTDRYVALAQGLLGRHDDLAVVVTGAPSERDAAAQVVERVGSPRCVSVAGRTTLTELLTLYHLAEVMVTNDSGPAHYATLTPMDTVALFGPETPAVFGPTGPQAHNMWAALPCSPCVNAFNNRLSPCKDNVCMQRLATDLVAERVCELLDQRG